jgi:hypothetical protein
MNPDKKEAAMKTKPEIILYTNHIGDKPSDYDEEARERAKEVYGDDVSDAELWDFIAEEDRIYWDDFMDEVKEWDRANRSNVVLHGTCGTWRGNFAGGMVFDSLESAISNAVHNKDYITITICENGEFLVQGYHHDGVNYWYIKAMTSKGLEWWNRHEYDHDLSREDIVNHLLEVKCYTRKIRFW